MLKQNSQVAYLLFFISCKNLPKTHEISHNHLLKLVYSTKKCDKNKEKAMDEVLSPRSTHSIDSWINPDGK